MSEPIRDSLRTLAIRDVQRWAVELEALMAGHSKHPLHRIRELHLAKMADHRTTAPGSTRLTARGSASRNSPGTVELRARLGSAAAEETHRIMRHVHTIDPKYWRVLLSYGLGFSYADQAKAFKKSKSTIEKWFEGGIAVVISARLCRTFADSGSLTRPGRNR